MAHTKYKALFTIASAFLGFEMLSLITLYSEVKSSVELNLALGLLALSVPCLAGAMILMIAPATTKSETTLKSLSNVGFVFSAAWFISLVTALSQSAGLIFVLTAGGVMLICIRSIRANKG